jgi:peptide/nickel transport system substrate-binding protein
MTFARLAVKGFSSAVLAITLSYAVAKELSIGLQSIVTSIDPHFHNTAQNGSLSLHIFESLIDFELDGRLNLRPSLATSWKSLDKTTWEFKLRENVKWHDGSPFTAADVQFTIQRAPNVPNSPSSFGVVTRLIKEVKVIDPLTVHIITTEPHPLLPRDLTLLRIVSKKFGEHATTADYNSGKAAIGTGPYRFIGYAPDASITVAKNEHYWGQKEPWDKVTFKFQPNASARAAALASREVDVIEGVPPEGAARLKADGRISLITAQSNRLIFLAMDSARDKSPFVTDKSGKAIDKNPLKDARVRKAISMAINRFSLVDQMLDGRGIVAGQLMPSGSFGTSGALRPQPFDTEQARKLLAESGYQNGFGITLHGPDNRYVHDVAVAQFVARMLAEIGIDAKVETMSASTYFSRASKLDFSFMLFGWGGNDVQEVAMVARSLLMTYNKEIGAGVANRGRYSNPALDKVIEEALASFSISKRLALSIKASEIAIADAALVPLYFEMGTWALAKPLTLNARLDQYTLAMNIR